MNPSVKVRYSLIGLAIDLMIHRWLDSTVALHWVNNRGDYLQFEANRVGKIQNHNNVTWRHAPTTDTAAAKWLEKVYIDEILNGTFNRMAATSVGAGNLNGLLA